MNQKELFKTRLVPAKPGSGKLFEEEIVANDSPVVCLGQEFENDEARREHFTALLREKLKDPEFRKIEGFPIGEDEDILALSDPPYYTACPNPWIGDFIKEWEKAKPQMDTDEHGLEKPYHREPFAADVSEGKNDPIYNAHSYHTKVPHKAIMRYILHYTEPGDIIFDGFCGTGMTGVAAQMCGDKVTVESLGVTKESPEQKYKVEDDGTINERQVNEEGKVVWVPFSKLGARRAVLNDLSPAATFIAYNYNTPVDVHAFEREAKRILTEVEDECGWMYETLHSGAGILPAKKVMENTGWKPAPLSEFKQTQRDLPHWQYPGAILFVTFNTYNNFALSEQSRDAVLSSVQYWHGSKINLFSAVVMPDHVHMVFQLLVDEKGASEELSALMHSIKSFSANQVNKIEKRNGILWQNESYDHIIRNENDLNNTLNYIYYNPVKKGIASDMHSYRWYVRSGEVEDAGWKPAPLGKINYTVWSDVFVCPECAGEVIFWEAAVDKVAGKVRDSFPCPHCQAALSKRNMERAWTTKYDKYVEQASSLQNKYNRQDACSTIKQAKQVPVLINYSVEQASSLQKSRQKRFEKTPDEFDLALIEKIDNSEIPYWFPTDRMIEGKETRRNDPVGITHVHHFYTKRNLWVLAALRASCSASQCLLLFNSQLINISRLNRYRPGVSFPYNPLSGTMYIGSQVSESNVFIAYKNKLKKLETAFKHIEVPSIIVTESLTVPFNIHVDYIFIDPPFGANLNYSELNFLWESWLKVITNNKQEAIENSVQKKGAFEYRQLMTVCFKEAYRVLKPGHWMTVEFSNTKASVWNSIQTALTEAGFIVANVSALDKKQGSFKAVTTPTAVKQDLIISAYKPNGGFEKRFIKEAQTEEGVWTFIRTHLKYLPVTKSGAGFQPANKNNTGKMPVLQFISERDPRILFDQVVAYYVRKGYPVPISSQEFQLGLSQRFSERDGMYFVPEQVAEYDRRKMIGGGRPVQAEMFVKDESSAIEWLRNLLRDKPQSFQDLNPQFMKVIGGWEKTEKGMELSTMLEQNFLCYADTGRMPVPQQIHSYLSTNWKEMRNLQKDDPALMAKAKNRWYVPDPNKAGDLEKIREKSLMKEFEEYKESMKKLKLFRLEAVRAGFKKCWQERDYTTIISVAEKIPNNILEEDPKLLMWYDQAVTRSQR